MSFVHVPDGRVVSQSAQSAHAADSEQNFLRDAEVQVAPIQARGQGTVGFAVAVHVGVQQVERDASDAHFPQLQGNGPVRELHQDCRARTVVRRHGQEGMFVNVDGMVDGFLPAVFADVLGKVTLQVEEADAHQRQAEVGGFLEVIARQHAQAARINGQGLVQAVLHREVSDGASREFGMGAHRPGRFLG